MELELRKNEIDSRVTKFWSSFEREYARRESDRGARKLREDMDKQDLNPDRRRSANTSPRPGRARPPPVGILRRGSPKGRRKHLTSKPVALTGSLVRPRSLARLAAEVGLAEDAVFVEPARPFLMGWLTRPRLAELAVGSAGRTPARRAHRSLHGIARRTFKEAFAHESQHEQSLTCSG